MTFRNKRYNFYQAADIEPRIKKVPYRGKGKVKISAACLKNKHNSCSQLKCECSCEHGIGGTLKDTKN